MGVNINDFAGKYIGLDTAPLIYFIEQNPQFYPKLRPIFEANDRLEFYFVSSYITLLEVLIKPLQLQKANLASQYHSILTHSRGMKIYEVEETVVYKAAELRAKYKVKTPDAIQIATAILNQCAYFLTNDDKLKVVQEIEVLTMLDI